MHCWRWASQQAGCSLIPGRAPARGAAAARCRTAACSARLCWCAILRALCARRRATRTKSGTCCAWWWPCSAWTPACCCACRTRAARRRGWTARWWLCWPRSQATGWFEPVRECRQASSRPASGAPPPATRTRCPPQPWWRTCPGCAQALRRRCCAPLAPRGWCASAGWRATPTQRSSGSRAEARRWTTRRWTRRRQPSRRLFARRWRTRHGPRALPPRAHKCPSHSPPLPRALQLAVVLIIAYICATPLLTYVENNSAALAWHSSFVAASGQPLPQAVPILQALAASCAASFLGAASQPLSISVPAVAWSWRAPTGADSQPVRTEDRLSITGARRVTRT